MKVALIAPIPLISRLPKTGLHMVLAHLLGNKQYRDSFELTKGHKILDNGAAEGAFVFGDLPRAAHRVGATEIIVPDVMGCYEETIGRAVEFLQIAEAYPQFAYTGVVHGQNEYEQLACLEKLLEIVYITNYALPRCMCQPDDYARVGLAARLHYDHPDVRFHALGSSAWCEEAKVLANLPNVVSMDTAMPVKLGMKGIQLEAEVRYSPEPHTDEYLLAGDVGIFERVALRNAETFLEWAQCDTH